MSHANRTHSAAALVQKLHTASGKFVKAGKMVRDAHAFLSRSARLLDLRQPYDNPDLAICDAQIFFPSSAEQYRLRCSYASARLAAFCSNNNFMAEYRFFAQAASALMATIPEIRDDDSRMDLTAKCCAAAEAADWSYEKFMNSLSKGTSTPFPRQAVYQFIQQAYDDWSQGRRIAKDGKVADMALIPFAGLSPGEVVPVLARLNERLLNAATSLNAAASTDHMSAYLTMIDHARQAGPDPILLETRLSAQKACRRMQAELATVASLRDKMQNILPELWQIDATNHLLAKNNILAADAIVRGLTPITEAWISQLGAMPVTSNCGLSARLAAILEREPYRSAHISASLKH